MACALKRECVAVMLDEGARLPTIAYGQSAGYDLYSRETKVVPAGGSAVFDTGVHIELKEGTAGILVSKSGLSINHGIVSEWLVDAGYTGSIRVKLYNNSGDDYTVNAGDKISQLVIVYISTPELRVVDHLAETERGNNGFGSSGK